MTKVDPYNSWDMNGDQNSWDINGDPESFENLLNLLDFPMESLEGDGLVGGDWDVNNSEYLGPIPGTFPSYEPIDPLMISQTKTEPILLHGQVGLNEVAPESKPLFPYRFEDTSCIRRQYEVQEQRSFQSQSPVSVLENGAGKKLLINSHVRKRTRTKRARPVVNPWLLLSPVFTAGMRKKSSHVEGAKKTFPDSPLRSSVAKKCAHCEVTKTPQWREGPMGPKTLCNACGVRYRSGRLYPEYRPAASPTFVPSVHSNSHKKVVEMRTKAKQHKVGNCDFFPVRGYL